MIAEELKPLCTEIFDTAVALCKKWGVSINVPGGGTIKYNARENKIHFDYAKVSDAIHDYVNYWLDRNFGFAHNPFSPGEDPNTFENFLRAMTVIKNTAEHYAVGDFVAKRDQSIKILKAIHKAINE